VAGALLLLLVLLGSSRWRLGAASDQQPAWPGGEG